MDVEVKTAQWVIRDVTIGRDFSFLMDAYKVGEQTHARFTPKTPVKPRGLHGNIEF